MLLCKPEHIIDLLEAKYAEACEKRNPGLIGRTIEAVSGEVSDALSYRYPQPWPYVPEIVRYIASVISAYRVVEAITSLVSAENDTDNEWIPLQKQWKQCLEWLDDIVRGRMKLPLDEAHPDREDASVAVVTRKPLFDLRGF